MSKTFVEIPDSVWAKSLVGRDWEIFWNDEEETTKENDTSNTENDAVNKEAMTTEVIRSRAKAFLLSI